MFQFQPFTENMKRFNHRLERLMPVITPTGVVLGLLLGDKVSWMKPAVNWLFGFLTMTSALSISVGDFGKTLKRPKFLGLFFLSAVIMMPLLTFGSASLCFPGNTDLITGYMLLMSIPTAVVGTVWSSIYQGNMAVSLTILLIDTLLAPFLTPMVMKVFLHTSIAIDSVGMMKSLLFMVVIPSAIGVAINQLTHGKVNNNVGPCLKPFGKIALFFVVIINTSKVSGEILSMLSWSMIPEMLLCIVLTALSFPLSYFLSKLGKCTREESVSVTFAASLRNISAALVLATDFFPPGAAVPVIIGIVTQQIICALMGASLFGKHDTLKKEKETSNEKHS